MVNRKTRRIGPHLRISAWLPPGLALGLLAVLAAFIHGPGMLLAVWAAATVFVVLTLLCVHVLQRRATSVTIAAQSSSARSDHVEAAASGQADAAAISTRRGSDPGPATGPSAESPTHSTSPAPFPSPIAPALIPQPGEPTVAELAKTLGLHVLTDAEVASVLRVDARAIGKAISDGKLPGNRIGDDWRVELGALRRWLQGRYPAPGAISAPPAQAVSEDEQN